MARIAPGFKSPTHGVMAVKHPKLMPGSSVLLVGFQAIDLAAPSRSADYGKLAEYFGLSVCGVPVPLAGALNASAQSSCSDDWVFRTFLAVNRPVNDWETPAWDTESRRLSFRGVLVKKLRSDAENQLIVLNALRKAGWPPWIANPLPPDDDVDVRERIYNTVKRLNRQRYPLLGFFADGSGTGIRWAALD